MNNFKAIFFDMDGLLVDTEFARYEIGRDVFRTIGIEMPSEWYVQAVLGVGKSSFDFLRLHGISEDSIATLRTERDRRYREFLEHNAQPMDGVVETLEPLRTRFVMGVVTSSEKNHFRSIMKRTKLDTYFDFFITAGDVSEIKPHPESYLAAVKISEKRPEQCLVLEDSLRGVQAAKAAGLTCYAIPDALTRAQNFSIADKVLGSIRELPRILGV